MLLYKMRDKMSGQFKSTKIIPNVLDIKLPTVTYHLSPLTQADRGNVYVLIIIDQFNEWIECFAMTDQTALAIANI